MKRFCITASIFGILGVLVYWVPIAVSSVNSRPLYGYFDMELTCIGGHEIFLFLDVDKAYENCPGHRDLSLMGRLDRNDKTVTIYRENHDAPWYRVVRDGSAHFLVFLDDSSKHNLPQVNNPWRTWLPRLLPGD